MVAQEYQSYRQWVEERRPTHVPLSFEQIQELFKNSSRFVSKVNNGQVKLESHHATSLHYLLEFVVVYEPVLAREKLVGWQPTLSREVLDLIGGLPSQETVMRWLGELGVYPIPQQIPLPDVVVSLPSPQWSPREHMFGQEARAHADHYLQHLREFTTPLRPREIEILSRDIQVFPTASAPMVRHEGWDFYIPFIFLFCLVGFIIWAFIFA